MVATAMPKHEVRAVWLTTIMGLDWPKTRAVSEESRKKQQQELCNILDRLQEDGINTVYLQTRTRGAVIYPSAIEPWDGALTGKYDKHPGYDPLAFAIDECHKRGIAVILDVVFNHSTGQFPWAKMWWNSSANKTAADNPFFNVDAPHNWSVYHDFNHTYPKTRTYFKEVLQYWLKEYKVDGYRFDLTKGLVQNPGNYDAGGYSAERIGILKDYANAIREVTPDAYIIFEHFCDGSEENELAAYKNIMLWRNVNSASCESAMGWTGSDKSNFSSISAYGRVGFAESHDEERVGYKIKTWGQTALKNNFPSANVATQLTGMYALEFLSPYAKMIWQFGELAYDYSIDYNDRTGEKPVPWELGYFEHANRKALYDNLSKIISFRTENPQIFSSDSGDKERKTWNVGDGSMGGKTLVLSNNYGGVIVVANQSTASATTTVSVPQTGQWTNILTGEKVTLNSSYTVTLAAHQCVVLGRVN